MYAIIDNIYLYVIIYIGRHYILHSVWKYNCVREIIDKNYIFIVPSISKEFENNIQGLLNKKSKDIS